jgi:hypothetical protein
MKYFHKSRISHGETDIIPFMAGKEMNLQTQHSRSLYKCSSV